jgi:hypothetical protein
MHTSISASQSLCFCGTLKPFSGEKTNNQYWFINTIYIKLLGGGQVFAMHA